VTCQCPDGPHYLRSGLPCRCRGCLGTPGAVHREPQRPPRARACQPAGSGPPPHPHPHPSVRGSAGAREHVRITLARARRGWSWARHHPWPAAIGTGVTVGVPALEWVSGGAGGQVGEVADVIAAAAVAALWRRLRRAQGLALAATASAASLTGWLGPLGHPMEQGGAQVAVALGVGGGLWAALRPRKRAEARPEVDVAAEVRRAMVEAGLVRNLGGGLPPETPRLVRGGLDEPGAAVVRLAWVLPPGVTPAKARAAEEALSHRLGARLDGASVRVVSGEHGEVVTEIKRGRLPRSVDFAAFYRLPLPAGDLVTGVGMSRGGPVAVDFGRVPHLLIGGMTNQGKSAAQRQMLVHLALELGPEQLQLALIDCKGGVELAAFARLPHARGPVAIDAAEAADLLGELGAELDRRWAELRRADLDEPNIAAWIASGGEPWPRVLCVVDEVAELTTSGDKKLAELATQRLERIARLGRAAGMHLILATQRPDATAVPGQLRACMAGALALRVGSEVNSRILLDDGRAAGLPDIKGRALWKVGGDVLEEVQTPYLSAGDARQLLERRWGRRPVAASRRPVSFPEDEAGLGNVVQLR
jgi:FtsK/SpoIIIE family